MASQLIICTVGFLSIKCLLYTSSPFSRLCSAVRGGWRCSTGVRRSHLLYGDDDRGAVFARPDTDLATCRGVQIAHCAIAEAFFRPFVRALVRRPLSAQSTCSSPGPTARFVTATASEIRRCNRQHRLLAPWAMFRRSGGNDKGVSRQSSPSGTRHAFCL